MSLLLCSRMQIHFTPHALAISFACIQTYWLLLALVQDNPKNKHIENLKEAVEIAALDGQWVSAWGLK